MSLPSQQRRTIEDTSQESPQKRSINSQKSCLLKKMSDSGPPMFEPKAGISFMDPIDFIALDVIATGAV